MEFKLGQKVLCVNDRYGSYCRYPLSKGGIYTIHGFHRCTCGSQQVTLMEIAGVVTMGCRCQRTSVRRHSYYIWRFIPLEYSETHAKALSDKNEILEKKDVSSKSVYEPDSAPVL
jgi:hypothetical protein